MSKFDKLFSNPPRVTNSSSGSGSLKYNRFIVKPDASEKAKAIYDYKEEAFPELFQNNKASLNTAAETKKYSDITATVNEVKKVQENRVPPGWIQFTRTKGKAKFDIVYGEKTKRQLEIEENDELLNNPAYIYNKMITKLSSNWLRYKTEYDSIHGEGAYDLVYYLDPVYPEDDELMNYEYTANNEYTNNEYLYDAE